MFALRACSRSSSPKRIFQSLWSTKWTRNVSTTSLDPCIRGFAVDLAKKQPGFSIHAKDVNVLSEPQQFYQKLLDMIRRAQNRIFISSLYIGSADRELIDTLSDALKSNARLEVYLQLDLNRSTRPGASSTARVLLPLLKEFPERFHVSLFRSPKLRGLMAKLVPPRFNEGWGTWHSKIYGVDDEVMISGANLNSNYFTDRQDRYIHFTGQPTMAQYCFSFLQAIASFSYKLIPATAGTSDEGYHLEWPDSDIHPHHFHAKAEKVISELQASYLKSSSSPGPSGSDVVVFPVIQGGQFNIREEERCLSMLFDHLASTGQNPTMHLTSGYFGLSKAYQDLVLRSSIDCNIIAASPKANGFYGSKGLSGRIPDGYTLLEQRFMRAVTAAGRQWSPANEKGVQLNLWSKANWTYHAKGIWLSPTPDSAPVATLFGSTNLNSRSANLDTELSFMMMTTSEVLRRKLHDEIQGLQQHAGPWTGGERRVPLTTKAIVGIVGGML
ncbi:hypothetical protein FIBSPDRAFT_938822 [Athelia psychrophila]|uniref:CDP-diacylglycerol--glycerol-3-phosphate 3-phosphatidyltransferase n=1 Tax=Athelia psychrophila TaxID=1759441 RepID=A0A165XMX7_9AGAM|nr:hypothetical protein FIBSPDRAFT_938822 [Fibularhizoctonia sp. CBS 109695]